MPQRAPACGSSPHTKGHVRKGHDNRQHLERCHAIFRAVQAADAVAATCCKAGGKSLPKYDYLPFGQHAFQCRSRLQRQCPKHWTAHSVVSLRASTSTVERAQIVCHITSRGVNSSDKEIRGNFCVNSR